MRQHIDRSTYEYKCKRLLMIFTESDMVIYFFLFQCSTESFCVHYLLREHRSELKVSTWKLTMYILVAAATIG